MSCQCGDRVFSFGFGLTARGLISFRHYLVLLMLCFLELHVISFCIFFFFFELFLLFLSVLVGMAGLASLVFLDGPPKRRSGPCSMP